MSGRAIIRDLGDGLLVRRASRADAEELSGFDAMVHGNMQENIPDERVRVWVQDLLTRPHPTFAPGDFTVVEDTASGKIVSSLNLISQTWTYEGIPFGVGRPELVGTLPGYRDRGLVRAQFDVIHAWSTERGELVQAITGIPYYYRLFGYEMGLDLSGGRSGFTPQVPRLAEGQEEPFLIRPAVENDLGWLAALYEQGCRRSLVSCVWDDALLRYELSGKSSENVCRYELRVIETPQGEAVGFLAHPPYRWGAMLAATTYELKIGISWADVTPSVIRYLMAAGANYKAEYGSEPCSSFGFYLGLDHPVYHVIPGRLPRVRPPYAWYVRVPDLPAFIRRISPVLDRRLAESYFVGYSGEFKLTFYRDGLRLLFDKGHLAVVERWQPTPQGHSGDAAFPNLTFLQLLFGYRSLEELRYAYADCSADSDQIAGLLGVLFPKKPSCVWPVS